MYHRRGARRGTGPRDCCGIPRPIPVLVVFLGALFFSPGGCAPDDVGPGKISGYVVWIAQEVNGTVKQEVTGVPVAGASVTLRAGFQLDALVPIAGGTTAADGSFRFRRSDVTGVAGDYWWFVVDDSAPVDLIVQAEVRHRNFLPAFPRVTLRRVPSRDPPTGNFGAYLITINVVMSPAPAP